MKVRAVFVQNGAKVHYGVKDALRLLESGKPLGSLVAIEAPRDIRDLLEREPGVPGMDDDGILSNPVASLEVVIFLLIASWGGLAAYNHGYQEGKEDSQESAGGGEGEETEDTGGEEEGSDG